MEEYGQKEGAYICVLFGIFWNLFLLVMTIYFIALSRRIIAREFLNLHFYELHALQIAQEKDYTSKKMFF